MTVEHALLIEDANGDPVCSVTITGFHGDEGAHAATHIRELIEGEYPNRVSNLHE